MRACAREGGIACYTQEEIGEAVGLFQQDVAKAVEAQKMEDLPKSVKLLAPTRMSSFTAAMICRPSCSASQIV